MPPSSPPDSATASVSPAFSALSRPGQNAAARKAALRAHLLKRRGEQPPDLARARSLEAQRRLLAAPCWSAARSVALYVALKGEMDTDKLLEAAWRSGRTLWLPRVRPGEVGRMEFVACAEAAQLRPGPFGLREPEDGLPCFGPEHAGTAFAPDLLILPGLAFDQRGGRLGFGGGYYDRFLDSGLTCPRVGLCFAFQITKNLPLEGWDQRVQYLCTEEQFLCL